MLRASGATRQGYTGFLTDQGPNNPGPGWDFQSASKQVLILRAYCFVFHHEIPISYTISEWLIKEKLHNIQSNSYPLVSSKEG